MQRRFAKVAAQRLASNEARRRYLRAGLHSHSFQFCRYCHFHDPHSILHCEVLRRLWVSRRPHTSSRKHNRYALPEYRVFIGKTAKSHPALMAGMA